MRLPGFGVGGYCLTKDPLLGAVAARELFGRDRARLPVLDAGRRGQPRRCRWPASASSRRCCAPDSTARPILLMGVSYRQDVADTRYSPSETFVREARAARRHRASATTRWCATGRELEHGASSAELPSPGGVDAVVFAVAARRLPRARPRALAGRRAARRSWTRTTCSRAEQRRGVRASSAAASRASGAGERRDPRADHRRRRVHRRPSRAAPGRRRGSTSTSSTTSPRGARRRRRRRCWRRSASRAAAAARPARRRRARRAAATRLRLVVHLAAIVGVAHVVRDPLARALRTTSRCCAT